MRIEQVNVEKIVAIISPVTREQPLGVVYVMGANKKVRHHAFCGALPGKAGAIQHVGEDASGSGL